MKTKDLFIRDYFYCADTDAFLLLAQRPAQEGRVKREVVGWMARYAPEDMIEPTSFLDPDSAIKHFKKLMGDGDRPLKLEMGPDKQKEKLYLWEDNFIYASDDVLFKTPEEAKPIIRKVSRDYGIPAPKLKWEKHTGLSEYDEEENYISFGHRSLRPLLHEMAHAIHAHRNDGINGPAHSPAFAYIVIELYNRYAGLDFGYLMQSAVRSGILGPVGSLAPQLYVGKQPYQAGLLKPTL